MAWLKVFFRCIGEAVCDQGLRAFAGVVPLGDVIYDVAHGALERLRRHQQHEEDRACLEAAAQSALAEHMATQLVAVPTSVPAQPAPNGLQTLLEDGPSSWLLDLTNKQIGAAGAATLAAAPSLARRSVLYLSGNQIGDAGARALAASPHMANVTRLILWDNRITDAGAQALAASPYLNNLSVLDLGHNAIGDDGVLALAAAPHLASLSALILVSNRIGDVGARALAESPYLANLAELKPLDNRISAAGVTLLRERFGKRVRIY